MVSTEVDRTNNCKVLLSSRKQIPIVTDFGVRPVRLNEKVDNARLDIEMVNGIYQWVDCRTAGIRRERVRHEISLWFSVLGSTRHIIL